VCVRQRLSSELDRYRGRRRVTTPPRSRYAAVVTTAFVGAGIVALGAAPPDAKSVSPSVLDELKQASITSQDAAARADAADRASRDTNRDAEVNAGDQDPWLLPLQGYDFNSPYGMRWGKLHTGIDLVAAEGTPYVAIHDGEVKAGWFGGYGYAVIVKHADGRRPSTATPPRSASRRASRSRRRPTWLVSNTDRRRLALHLEVHVGQPLDPVPWLQERGVDIKLQVEAIYSEVAAS
jgi:murein DD-endopeptidase MepM/ murein hydrolase activator NlpD